MGIRVRICEKHENKNVFDDKGAFVGYDLVVRYSKEQRDWFNNGQYDLAMWLNEYVDDCPYLEGDESEWELNASSLEKMPDEAYAKPPPDHTEDEMRRFVAECVKCADEDGFVHLEWW